MSPNQQLDVVFTIDKNFIQHFCVSLTSLLENNKEQVGRIFLIHDIKEKFLLKKTFSFIKKKYGKEIIHVSFDNSTVENFKIDGHITQATYYRLFLSEILPKDIDRILFLDSDIIINGKLDLLLTLDFKSDRLIERTSSKANPFQEKIGEELNVYAVSNLADQDKSRLKNLGLVANRYFNAGVLLINLKKWRKDAISEKLIKVAQQANEKLMLHDQDVLNIVFENYWGELDAKFNAINLEFCGHLQEEKKYVIIHFTNYPKPWHFKNRHPFRKLYWYYLRKTPFRFYVPNDLTFRNIMELKIIPKTDMFIAKLLNNRFYRLSNARMK